MNIHDGSINGKPDYYWLNQNKERLKYLEENKYKLINEKKIKDKELKYLSQKIEDIIIRNPEILQSDLYKDFDPMLKDEISTIIYYWNKEEKVVREKSGRTYKLFFRGDE